MITAIRLYTTAGLCTEIKIIIISEEKLANIVIYAH